jgi:hypothetical protein
MIETLEDIVEGLADKLKIYGAHDDWCDGTTLERTCRCCWTSNIQDRILRAVAVESAIHRVDMEVATPAIGALNCSGGVPRMTRTGRTPLPGER